MRLISVHRRVSFDLLFNVILKEAEANSPSGYAILTRMTSDFKIREMFLGETMLRVREIVTIFRGDKWI